MIRGRTSKIFIIGLFTLLFFFLSVNASAQYGEYGQYGGPVPSKTILIEKMVSVPNQTKGSIDQLTFVDNLSPSDSRFAPNQQIVFKLKVKNTSDVSLTNVAVKDLVPDFLTPVSGSGTFDEASRTVSFNAGNFAVGEEKTYFLTMKIASQDQIPADKGMFCEINKAQASTSEVFDEDTAQFCIEKQVMGVSNVPSAGPEMGFLLFSLELGVLGAGIVLKRRSR